MAGRLITSGPNKYTRPGSVRLTTSQIISNVQNEQQRVNEEKNIKDEKANKKRELFSSRRLKTKNYTKTLLKSIDATEK